ncbi:MAG TPA: phosphoenolpyruvate--protein phosphotransferase [Spirochaetales bacterium]|nr:phosphoenolpyruvate--protein phosphotransferase [Spirochaetales bacterium]
MEQLKGIMVSPGIAIGRAYVYAEQKYSIPRYDISADQVIYEAERFLDAVQKAGAEIEALIKETSAAVGDGENSFLNAHLLMLNDPEFHERVNENLKQNKQNVEWILLKVAGEIAAKLDSLTDEYLRERGDDIYDVSQRIISQLLCIQKISLADLDEESIVVAHNLLPSDAVTMNKQKVIGIATDVGGKTSHTAILARSFEIPAVLGLSNITQYVQTGDELIVDGTKGLVIVKPDKREIKKYYNTLAEWHKHELQLLNLNKLPAETRDGKMISLEANIEIPEEVESVIAHGADGIGLYRSEFLFIRPNRFPTEEEQFQAYRSVLESVKGKSVTIRTVDLGGDKVIPGFNGINESNPILGWRAVRFCLSRPDIFKAQLRAMLRSSVYGNLKIMFPMISGIEELESILTLLEETKDELKGRDVPFNNDIPVGIMIEVPSAAFTSDILARQVDFVSIGTNDLIQYTIAVDRENERIAYLYEPFHPAVLRLIKLIVDNCHEKGIPVGMCGEMAGDLNAAVILIGLGLDELSMSPIVIPEIKKIIRSITIAEAEEVVGTIMAMKSFREIDIYMKQWSGKHLDFISY